MKISMLLEIGLVGTVYLITRFVGKILGSWIGAYRCNANAETRRWMGVTLTMITPMATGELNMMLGMVEKATAWEVIPNYC